MEQRYRRKSVRKQGHLIPTAGERPRTDILSSPEAS